MSQTSADLYQARTQRVMDAIAQKTPDRVPFMPFFHLFPATYTGLSFKEAMYDYDRLADAAKKAILDFEPDMYQNPLTAYALGPLLDTLDYRQLKWPGHGLTDDQNYQFVEREYMTISEYDAFLSDPTDFMARVFLPRAYGALEGLKMLPSLPSLYYTRFLTGTAALALPEVTKALESLLAASVEASRLLTKANAFTQEMAALGFPSQVGGVAYAPFDYIGDFFRGTRGVLTDMFRAPDKLMAAMEKIIPNIVEGAESVAQKNNVPFIFIPLHKGLDTFMSLDQFKTFYWPTLKHVIETLIDKAFIPVVLWEGDCTSRLETIADIPAGKAVYWFEKSDIFKAKKILGQRVCIRGNVPAATLIVDSPEDVKKYCKRLIREVGQGGGFILDGSVGIPDEAKPENVQAMVEAVREYGVY
jgi:hypothetical protein